MATKLARAQHQIVRIGQQRCAVCRATEIEIHPRIAQRLHPAHTYRRAIERSPCTALCQQKGWLARQGNPSRHYFATHGKANGNAEQREQPAHKVVRPVDWVHHPATGVLVLRQASVLPLLRHNLVVREGAMYQVDGALLKGQVHFSQQIIGIALLGYRQVPPRSKLLQRIGRVGFHKVRNKFDFGHGRLQLRAKRRMRTRRSYTPASAGVEPGLLDCVLDWPELL